MSNESLAAQLLDEAALTLDELAQACGVEPDWVVQHVRAGVLGGELQVELASWRFGSGDLGRSQRQQTFLSVVFNELSGSRNPFTMLRVASGMAEGLRIEQFESALLGHTEDAKEGPKAFAEKRAPNYVGR